MDGHERKPKPRRGKISKLLSRSRFLMASVTNFQRSRRNDRFYEQRTHQFCDSSELIYANKGIKKSNIFIRNSKMSLLSPPRSETARHDRWEMGSFLSDREKYRQNIEGKKFLNSKLVLCEISTRELIRLVETRSRFERGTRRSGGERTSPDVVRR